jgi:DNA-binding MarR family transcriptional regulator
MPKPPGEEKGGRGPGPARETPLRTVDIVRWLYQTRPDRFTVNDIADEYDITNGEANRRVKYMAIYGLAKKLGEAEVHRVGRRQILYTLTDWGRKYASNKANLKKKRPPASGRVAANPEDES